MAPEIYEVCSLRDPGIAGAYEIELSQILEFVPSGGQMNAAYQTAEAFEATFRGLSGSRDSAGVRYR